VADPTLSGRLVAARILHRLTLAWNVPASPHAAWSHRTPPLPKKATP